MHPPTRNSSPPTLILPNLPRYDTTMPTSTSIAEIHVFLPTFCRFIIRITGRITTVIEIVNAPVDTSNSFSPY